jgi:hypothetical protein
MPRQALDIAVGLSFERVEIGDDVLSVDAAGKVHEHFCPMLDASGARQKLVERGVVPGVLPSRSDPACGRTQGCGEMIFFAFAIASA